MMAANLKGSSSVPDCRFVWITSQGELFASVAESNACCLQTILVTTGGTLGTGALCTGPLAPPGRESQI
jgi:hypothetical protein